MQQEADEGGCSDSHFFSGFNFLSLSGLQEAQGLQPCENSPSIWSPNKQSNQATKSEGSQPLLCASQWCGWNYLVLTDGKKCGTERP